MFARTSRIVLACIVLSGCAKLTPGVPGHTSLHPITPGDPASGDPIGAAQASDSQEAPRPDRFRFVDQSESGLHSVFLVPTAVEELVAVGPMARSRLFVGALFATQIVGPNRVAGVGLIIKSVGGGLGPALSVSPWIVLKVDGKRVLSGSLATTGLYSAKRGPWGPEETLTFRVSPEIVEQMAGASEVEVQVGDLVIFQLGETHRADFRAFLEQIPEGTSFERRPEFGRVAGWRTQ